MAGAGQRFILPNAFVVSATGVPRAGAKLWFYETGTDTPQDTYSDSNLTVVNANPVVADANGQFGNIFLLGSPSYNVVLTDPSGVQIWAMDPVGPAITNTAQVPVGSVMDFAGAAAPAGWLLCYGQTISRTTYAALYTAIGTTYGQGDGATTFALPDTRGRASFGVDNMGGTAANRLTSAGSGVNGIVLGATGGDEMLQEHEHDITDPEHSHDLTDDGHSHTPNIGAGFVIPQGGNGDVTASFSGGGDTPETATSDTATAETGITVSTASTGITVNNEGTGAGQNVPPAIVFNKIIYTGVGG